MKKGDIVLVALSGDYGKPRPAVIAQSDIFNDTHPSVVICPVTSELKDAPLFRMTLEPSGKNGLKHISQVMLDKPQTIKRERIGERIGSLEQEQIIRMNHSLLLFLGLA